MRTIGITALMLILLSIWMAEDTQAQSPPNVPVDVDVPILPTPVKAEANIHLVYELHVTNLGTRELALWRVEVLSDDRDGLTLARYEDSDLTERLARPGAPSSLPDKRRIGPGMRAVVFLWITVDARSSLPGALLHRLTFTNSDSGNSVVETVVEVKRVKAAASPIAVGPPLRGSQWLAANGPSNISVHRRALIPVEGKARIAQRFAIDWVKLGDDGMSWSGDRQKNSSYRAYGAEVLAVADGVVASVKDGIPENVPGPTSRAVPITLETAAGNYVSLDLGSGRYAFYGHFQPGGVRVKPGDRVRRGEVLGLVGNSGNSTEPHLHFHIGDSNSPLGAEGLPYVLDVFEALGRGWGWKPSDSGAAPEERRLEIPLQNLVVRFKEAAAEHPESFSNQEADPTDVVTIDSIVASIYDVISGPAGKKRDWRRFRSLFIPAARLLPVLPGSSGGSESRGLDVEGYIAATNPHFEKSGFFEKEIARRTETFGHIAHVFSTYESRRKAEDPAPFARGINSIQLMNDGKRWWVVAIFWEAEGPNNPIPKKYLAGKQ